MELTTLFLALAGALEDTSSAVMVTVAPAIGLLSVSMTVPEIPSALVLDTLNVTTRLPSS